MKTFHLIFNHSLTEAQREDSTTKLGVSRIVTLPSSLQRLWSQVPADAAAVGDFIAPVLEYIRTEVKEDDVCLVQGDFGATCLAVQAVWRQGARAVYATTRRNVTEEKLNNRTEKISIFEHVMFREYERLEK